MLKKWKSYLGKTQGHLQLLTNVDKLGQNQLIINKYAVRSRYSL